MGSRSDVAITFTAEGWRLFQGEFLSAQYTQVDKQLVIDCLNSADEAREDDDGNKLFVFWSIKTYANDFVALRNMVYNISDQEYLEIELAEDGQESSVGYCSDPFNTHVVRTLSFDTSLTNALNDCGISMTTVGCGGSCNTCPSTLPSGMDPNPCKNINIAPAIVNAPVDDYTCSVCKNNKLNRATDTVCWKCGTRIN